jgi:hypothetical protein
MSTLLESTNRIKFVYYLHSWAYGSGDRKYLESNSNRVLISDFEPIMSGHIFCPVCFTNLVRVPKHKDNFSNGRTACFAHLSKYKSIPCDLRSERPVGKFYANEEDAIQAIDNNELVVVSAFSDLPSSADGMVTGVYDQSAVEDINGPRSEVALGRHIGKKYSVPTRISTITNICRQFDSNLYRYYVFPDKSNAVRLMDTLTSILDVVEPMTIPRLYIGKIKSSNPSKANPRPKNLRMTWLECHKDVKDFCLKDPIAAQTQKGISDDSKGRYVLFWGCITVSGIGLCVSSLKWGEYALLPETYETLADTIYIKQTIRKIVA